MSPKGCAALVAVVLGLTSSQARAAVCLDRSMTIDEIVDVINASTGCDRAMKIFQQCELSSSGDVDLGAAVEKKCEADFLTGLKAPQKRSYQNEMRACDRKYEKQEGTMYRSFTAFCRAEVARRHSRRARGAARSSR